MYKEKEKEKGIPPLYYYHLGRPLVTRVSRELKHSCDVGHGSVLGKSMVEGRGGAMMGKNRQLVTDDPVELQDFRNITDHFRGIIYGIYPNSMKENRRM